MFGPSGPTFTTLWLWSYSQGQKEWEGISAETKAVSQSRSLSSPLLSGLMPEPSRCPRRALHHPCSLEYFSPASHSHPSVLSCSALGASHKSAHSNDPGRNVLCASFVNLSKETKICIHFQRPSWLGKLSRNVGMRETLVARGFTDHQSVGCATVPSVPKQERMGDTVILLGLCLKGSILSFEWVHPSSQASMCHAILPLGWNR